MRRALWLLPLLAVLAVWLLFLQDEHGEPSVPSPDEVPAAADGAPTDAREEPVALRGSPDARLPDSKEEARAIAGPPFRRPRTMPSAQRTFHGVVVASDGQPVLGATVYQLRKYEQHRADRSGVPHASTDAEGRFTLRGHRASEFWLGAQAPGHITAFLKGTRVRVGDEVRFVLEPSPRLRVRLLDGENRPVPFARVAVVPTEGRGPAVLYPGPDAGVAELFEMTGADGVADFHLDRRVPVMVIPEIEDLCVEPVEQWLPEPEGDITFLVGKGTLLVVLAFDTQGKPVTGPVWVTLYDRVSGKELTSFRSAGHDHEADMDLALAPGAYAVEVTAEGREPVVVSPVELPGNGARVQRIVHMEALAPGGTLRLELAGGDQPEAGRRKGLVPPRILVRRTEVGFRDLGWQSHAGFRIDAKTRDPIIDLRPGTYDVILCLPTTRQVGLVEGVRVESETTATRRVVLREGVLFSAPAVLPPDLEIRALHIESSRLGRLPCVGRFMASSLEDMGGLLDTIDAAGSPSRRLPERGPWLGPYPGPTVTVVVTDWRGAEHRFVAGRRR